MSQSEGVKASWANEETAARRKERTNVVVEGHGEFRSVRQAFRDLGLPEVKHGKFRMDLKAKGEHTFEHEGTTFHFKVKQAASAAT